MKFQVSTCLILLVFLLLLVACQQEKEFIQPDYIVPPEEAQEPSKAGDVSAREELQSLLNNEPVYRGEYAVKSSFNDQKTSGLQIIAINGENSKQAAENDSLYIIGDEVYVCQKEESWRCFNVPQEKPPEKVKLSLPENLTVNRLEGRSIAGEEARCFEINAENEKTIHCVAKDGILLFFSRESDGFSMETKAEHITRVVPDSEFHLPAKAEEVDPSEFVQNAQPI